MDEGRYWLSLIGIVVVALGIVIMSSWWAAGQESNAYYRATGKRVSQWDAIFLELRVNG